MVLVADDEPTMLELVTRHLRSIEPKLEVIEASDGDEAWRLARERLPDLVVLDVMMPGMSGWEVCRKIREDVALAHTGVVMLTGIGENLNQMTSPLYGADAYIDKPFEFDELDEKVKNALSARAAQRDAVSRPAAAAATNVNGVTGPATPADASPAKKRKASGSIKAKAKAKAKASSKKTPAKTKTAAPSRAKGTKARKQKPKKGDTTMAAKKGAKKAAKKTAKKAAKKGGAKKKAK
jgi:DNA-binding response OmpR family regulator